jgi:hypothetical protein
MSEDRRLRELREARAEMTRIRERIYQAAAGRSDAQLLAVPPFGGWCAAEVLDHIATAERKLVKGLVRVANGQPVRLPRLVWFYRLPMKIAFSKIKIKAPGPVRPRAAAEIVPGEALASLRASREELLALADKLGEQRYSRLLFPHFLLGRFDGLDWFHFMRQHEGRHLAQLERILAAVPKAA